MQCETKLNTPIHDISLNKENIYATQASSTINIKANVS